nr:beta-propeller domain-containing protein [bacterium]
MKVGWGKAVVGLLLLSLLTVLFVSAGCDRGDDDDDGVDMDKKGLYRCKDCNDVLSWLREMELQRMVRALEMERDYWQNGGYYDDDDGWFDDDGDDVVSDDDDAAPGDDDDAAADDDAADDDNYEGDDDEATGDDDDDNEHSDTNVQEEGVDEADMIKTDGNYLFIANGGWLLIFDADPQEDTHQVGALDIEGNVADMYLYGDTALVFSLVPSYSVPETVWPEIPRDELYWDVVKVSVVDHSDKSDPTLLRELYVEGNLLNSRRIGATTRIVTNCFKNGPEYETWIDGWSYETPEEIDAAIDALIEQNTEIIDSAGLEAWLPRYYDIVH